MWWQKPNCCRLVKHANQLFALLFIDIVAFTDIVNELTAFYFGEAMLFHPNSKGILPVKEYAIRIN
jgi:hypothetical protein